MSADWTVLGVATITAGATILASWLAARRQATNQEREYAEQHLQHRQDVYHRFLNMVSSIDLTVSALGSRLDPVEAYRVDVNEVRNDLLRQISELREQLNGLRLFGTREVRDAAEEVDALVRPAEGEARIALLLHDWSGASLEVQLLKAWNRAVDNPAWKPSLAALEEAMRGDVSP